MELIINNTQQTFAVQTAEEKERELLLIYIAAVPKVRRARLSGHTTTISSYQISVPVPSKIQVKSKPDKY
jgi:hypothetical protein